MVDLFRDVLLSPFGSFASVFSLFALAFWLVYWITKKVTTINNSHDGLCGKIDKIETHIDEIRKDLSYMGGSLDILRKGGHPLAQSNSPVSLTKLGSEISQKLNAENMVANNWDVIYKNLEDNICDKNAYDIQEYCIRTATVELDKFLRKEDVSIVKQFAYKEGQPLAYYAPVFGIIIRDKYLQIKGIDSSEIDKHDPLNKTKPQ